MKHLDRCGHLVQNIPRMTLLPLPQTCHAKRNIVSQRFQTDWHKCNFKIVYAIITLFIIAVLTSLFDRTIIIPTGRGMRGLCTAARLKHPFDDRPTSLCWPMANLRPPVRESEVDFYVCVHFVRVCEGRVLIMAFLHIHDQGAICPPRTQPRRRRGLKH